MRAQRKAAGRAATTATTKLNRSQPYPPRPRRSSTDTRISLLPGTALGWLIVYLVSRDLPEPERCLGWALAERWLAELVVTRRKVEVA